MGLGFFYIIHMVICVVLVCIVLLQDGKTGGLVSVADTGNTMFGAKGASSFLTKVTSGLAIAFMVSSVFLAFRNSPSDVSVASDYVPPKTNTSEPTIGTQNPQDPTANELDPSAAVEIVDEQGNVIGTKSLSESLQDYEVVKPEDMPEDLRKELEKISTGIPEVDAVKKKQQEELDKQKTTAPAKKDGEQ